ncbi:MAG TPA: transposase [Candidatus Paceibacterota bacterium]
MATRKITFAEGEYYHICNRGVDGRNIFNDKYDVERFLQSLIEFNTIEPIGSLYENSFALKSNPKHLSLKKARNKYPLVNLIAYCLNPNHFHILLEQVSERGVSKFMQRIGGYSWYFNKKYKRKGSLFQNKFQAKHITSNEYLQYVSAYVNLNNRVHQLGGKAAKLVRSSWKEYVENDSLHASVCTKNIILNQFKTSRQYELYALDTLNLMLDKKNESADLKDLTLED